MSGAMMNQREPASTQVGVKDFPSLYQNADNASSLAQRSYFRFQKAHIFSLIFVSVLAAIVTLIPDKEIYVYICLALVLIIDVILAWGSRQKDQVWFDCRAIAESTKTTVWRFMMKTEPFKDDNAAPQMFVKKIRQIRTARPFRSEALAQSLDPDAQMISHFMKETRKRPLKARLDLYLNSRLYDQKVWYSKKAKFNAKRETHLFWTVIVLQILAILFAIIRAFFSSLPVDFVPFLTTCAASAIAWSHMKRYGELARTYFVAAQELGEQEALASNITEESPFVAFVDQVEGTISREHTMWCTRRDAIINPTDKED